MLEETFPQKISVVLKVTVSSTVSSKSDVLSVGNTTNVAERMENTIASCLLAI